MRPGGRPVGCGLLRDSGPGRAPDPAAVRPQAAVIPPALPTSPVTWRPQSPPASPGLLAAALPCRAWEGLPAKAGCRGAERAGQCSGSAAGWHSGCVVGGTGCFAGSLSAVPPSSPCGARPLAGLQATCCQDAQLDPPCVAAHGRAAPGSHAGPPSLLAWGTSVQLGWRWGCRGWPPVPRLC